MVCKVLFWKRFNKKPLGINDDKMCYKYCVHAGIQLQLNLMKNRKHFPKLERVFWSTKTNCECDVTDTNVSLVVKIITTFPQKVASFSALFQNQF